MNSTAKLETAILAAALTLGIAGDALLRRFPWGLNFALWVSLLAVAVFSVGRARPDAKTSGGWLLLPLGLSALGFVWRAAPALKALNLLALLTAMSLALLRAQGARLRESSLVQYGLGSVIAALNAAFGIFPLVFGKAEWKKSTGAGHRSGVALLKGAALSVVPLAVFGSLLMAADAVFQNLLHRLWHFDPTHFLVVIGIAGVVGGYLRGVGLGNEFGAGTAQRLLAPFVGAIELGVLLGTLDLLFLVFVGVQVRYYFGGSRMVQTTTGLSYAQYARSGFFELVAVAALVLPFLLLVHWLVRRDDGRAQQLFRWAAGVQISLLFVIMASAVERMWLYQREYGLSQQRFYPTAFMAWLAVVLGWFGLTVLRGRRERFAFGAMVAGFLLVAVLQIANPDGLIARTNLARARDGKPLDMGYVAGLSADAVPATVAGISNLPPGQRCRLAQSLLARWARGEDDDWRSWTLSRAQARQAVRDNALLLPTGCGHFAAAGLPPADR